MENQELWVVGNGAEERDALRYGKCDKYDYLAAVCCGAVAGLVDIFLVGSPIDWTAGKGSVLGSWTDKQVDEAVMRFAGLCGWKKNRRRTYHCKCNRLSGTGKRSRENGTDPGRGVPWVSGQL